MSAEDKITLDIFPLCPLENFLRGCVLDRCQPENAVSLNGEVVVAFLAGKKVNILRGYTGDFFLILTTSYFESTFRTHVPLVRRNFCWVL